MAQSSPGGAIREVASVWWLLVLTGLLSLVAGVVVLIEPQRSLLTLTVVAGIFVIVDSGLEVIYAIATGSGFGPALLGVLGVVIGILLVRYPIHSVMWVALLLGIWLVALGVQRLVVTIQADRNTWSTVVATFEIIAGVVIVSSPHIGVSTLAVIVGISFILNGFGMAFFGLTLRTLRRIVE